MDSLKTASKPRKDLQNAMESADARMLKLNMTGLEASEGDKCAILCQIREMDVVNHNPLLDYFQTTCSFSFQRLACPRWSDIGKRAAYNVACRYLCCGFIRLEVTSIGCSWEGRHLERFLTLVCHLHVRRNGKGWP